jgi:hypothetical protein
MSELINIEKTTIASDNQIFQKLLKFLIFCDLAILV